MAKILSKAGITTSGTVQAGHVSQSIDAFAGLEAYDITLSGSFNMVSGSITGQPGVINNLTASYAIVALTEITKEVSSSFADLAANLTMEPSIVVTQITASSNISSSGTIVASNFSGTTSGTNTGDQNILNLAITGSNVIFNNITASGDISSSGTVTAAAAVLTTADINGGTVDGITSLTAGGDLDIGAHKLRAETFQSDIATGTAPFTVASTTTVTNLEAATVATIAGLAPNTATTQATQASITTAANLTTVGALNAGSITSGFTSIDVGSGAITTTGVVSAGTINASGNISASQVFDGTYYQWEVSVLADTDDDTNWQGPPTTGLIGATNWSKDFGTEYNGTANIVQTRTNINTGWRIPHSANYSASIKSIDVYVGGGTNATIDASDHLSASLWYSTAADVDERLNQTGTTGITQRHGGTAITTQVGQTLVKFNNYLISQSIDIDLAPGAMLFPRVKMANGSSQNLLWNIYYIVNYCKKPL